MKLLIVGMPFSIHVVRWIELIDHKQWEVHFFSSFPYAKPHSQLSNVIYHDYPDNQANGHGQSIVYRDFADRKLLLNNKFLYKYMGKASRFLKTRKDHAWYLAKTIARIQPDIIHTMESQHGGYLASEVLNNPRWRFPKPLWIHTTFGIDLDYFQHFPEHRQKLQSLFSGVDLYLAEGDRDINYAKKIGYRGKVMKFPSAGGGYQIEKFKARNKVAPSQRKLVMIKGYQDAVRRGLTALQALVLCKDALGDFELIAYSCPTQVKDYIRYINSRENLNIKIYKETGYEDWLTTLSQARISITNNLSDGIPSSLFESMLLGVFPVQSNTSSADEWVEDKKTGFLVSPEDPMEISNAIRRALTDDRLVDDAAPINFQKVASTLSTDQMQEQVRHMYRNALDTKSKRATAISNLIQR